MSNLSLLPLPDDVIGLTVCLNALAWFFYELENVLLFPDKKLFKTFSRKRRRQLSP